MEDEHLDPSAHGDQASSDEGTIKCNEEHNHIADVLEEERQDQSAEEETPEPSGGVVISRYRQLLRKQDDSTSDSGSAYGLPRRAGSPIESLLSAPDDTASVQGSILSSPGSSVLPSVASRPGLSSPTPSFRPFDRRFQSRISSPSIHSPRPSSPAYLTGHSRNVSMISQFQLDPADTEASSPPWEVVRWTRLMKLNGQAFSEAGKRNFGSPTCIAVSASVILGTSKGIILVFDYNQNLKMIIGPGTKAVESGAVTAVATSADHSTIAGGHANGSIFTWDTSRGASRPFLHIPHLDAAQMQNRTMDGHLQNVAITHLGFLGTRHTALVSADDRGMAFSHLATRGTGALGRTVKTVRILGRYPDAPLPAGKTLKPSTVLGFASLPLGNIERATDTMGLTAMLTPYLLVIVSTTPIAQTQHKSARPKDVVPHSAMSGCLAWFPAVKLKVPDPHTGSTMSKVKLVYCWSNVLTVLDVDEIPTDDKDKPPDLKFRARSRWKCEEAIVAVQWISRSVLTVLTITQRLIVLEDRSMRMTEAFDLIHKHIYHTDLFSKQLHALVEQLDEDDQSMHGVVADAFYMSFKTYKGRIFLLGFNDVSIGALSNWADRLIALMENGDYIGAIQLATTYYTGDADKLTVGLPEDTALRHKMVRDKLIEIMSASLKYAFHHRQALNRPADHQHLRNLAVTCFVACQSVGDEDFLFDEMWEWYEDGEVEGLFLETLEPYILEKTITEVPPTVVKSMVTHFVSQGWESRLEEIICHLETPTLDIDQITSLCKQHGLYDALIYVWNQALNDYVTPMIDLLTLLVPVMQDGEYASSGDVMGDEMFSVNALKIFPYLSYTLTGRIYPTGESIDDDLALQSKAELYWFLFSGKSIAWPKGTSKPFRTRPTHSEEPSFPYLRMILKFDAPSFLSALNEAFEDAFLNDAQEKQLNGGTGKDLPEELTFGLTVDRQYVVSILLEIMNPADFAPEDTIYLDMFIARNLSKFPQYLLLPGSTLNRVISGLCRYPGADLADDAQLSAEYLLSVYHPPDMTPLIPLFQQAGFYRILKRIYKNDKQYGQLLQTYFEDPEDQEEVFDCIADCLRPQAGLTKRQIHDVHGIIKQHAEELVALDPAQAAGTLAKHAPELHHDILDALPEGSELRYEYLKTLLEPEEEVAVGPHTTMGRDLVEQYVQLMCRHNPSHVSEYVGIVQATDLNLEKLLPTMEETGVIDAVVILMAREGQVQDAMERLTKHLNTLESVLQGLLAGADGNGKELDVQESAEDLLKALQRYTHVGIWLCQGQMKTAKHLDATTQRRKSSPTPAELTLEEKLWLSLIESTVAITVRLSSVVSTTPTITSQSTIDSGQQQTQSQAAQQSQDAQKLVSLLRSLVQHTFTALLTATSSQSTSQPSITTTVNKHLLTTSTSSATSQTFLRILRSFLSRAAATSPTLADLRAVLTSIFAAYAYEESILRLSNRLLEQQLFTNVRSAVGLRQRGWRPRGSVCEACGRRAWGPGVQGNVFEAWEERRRSEERARRERRRVRAAEGGVEERGKGKAQSSVEEQGGGDGKGKGKGKGKGTALEEHSSIIVDDDPTAGDHDRGLGGDTEVEARLKEQQQQQQLGPLVVLACRHIYHQSCLDTLQAQSRDGDDERGSVDDFGHVRHHYRCPIDG